MKMKFRNWLLALTISCLLFTVGCTVDQVLSDINLLLQTASNLATAVGAVSPADAAGIQIITGIASTGLTAIQQDYDTYRASGATSDLQKLKAAIFAVKVNLPQELAAAHVSNSGTTTKVTAWVNLVTTTLDGVLLMLPQLDSAGAPRAARVQIAVELPTADSLHARWQDEVCAGDAACGQLVKPKKVKAKKITGSFWHNLGTSLGEAKFGG